jgi:hypothetical protein
MQLSWRRKLAWASCLFTVIFISPSVATSSRVTQKIEKPVSRAIDIRRKAQQKEEQWRVEQQQKVSLFERLKQEQETLKEQQQRLIKETDALNNSITEKKEQLQRIEQIAAQINPFLAEVVGRLDKFQQRDLPFLQHERQQRIIHLQEIVAAPDIAMNEKLRKVLEALMVEADYGRTLELTRETIQLAERETLVDVFRLGRIALYFRTLDGRESGFFNVAEQRWQPLSASFHLAIGKAMDIGAKKRPVEIVTLPLGRLQIQ